MIYTEILTYLRVIARRWWIIAILFVTTMSVVVLGNVTRKPVYRAQVRLQVLAAERQEIYLFSQFRSSGLSDEVREAQNDFVRQLHNPTVARYTRNDLSLTMSDMELLSGLSVSTDGDFITVVGEAAQPELAEAIVTRQVANALTQFRKVRSKPSEVLLTFITEQLKIEEDQMLKAEEALIAFKREHSLEDLEREILSYQDGIRSLKQQIDQAQALQQQLLARAAREREQAKALEARAAEISATAPYSAGSVREQANKYSSLALEHEMEASAQATAAEEYQKLVTKRQNEMRALLDLNAQYNALRRRVDQASGNYSFLVSKFNEARLKVSQAQNLGFIQIVDPASKPSAPAQSKLAKVALVAGVVSILAGVILAFALEFIDSLRKRGGLSWTPR